jgi:hypothetical protein
MQRAQLVVESDPLGRSAAGLVFGKVYLLVNGTAFPDPDWTDFALVVLGWWCRAACQLLDGEAGRVQVRFMEGPFAVELQVGPSGIWHVALVESTRTKRLHGSADIDAAGLVRSVVDGAQRVLMECRRRNWWSADADELESCATELGKRLLR